MGTAAAEQLKKKYPTASITYVTGCRSLCETNPFIDHVIAVRPPADLRKEYLLFFLLRPFFKKAYHLLFWLPHDNILQDFMGKCELPRCNVPVNLFLTEGDKQLAKEYYVNLNLLPTRRTLAIQKDFDRKWNSAEFHKLKTSLSQKYNLVEIGEGMQCRGKMLNMREAAAVIRRCDLYVGGISGTMHAAVAVGVPTVAIPNVSNPHWDMPEFYQNTLIPDERKRHVTVWPERISSCGNYQCVSLTKDYVDIKGGGFATKTCAAGFPLTCVQAIPSEQVLKEVDQKISLMFDRHQLRHLPHNA